MKKTALTIAIGQILALSAYAEETAPANNHTETLETVHVQGTPFSQQIGTQKIDEKQISRSPSTNGNITELLKSNPNVQFSNTAESSTNGGEIKPDEVSFHGEKFYNNNFMIDGISNNDNLNPGSSARSSSSRQPQGTNAYDLPAGDTQSFWINTRLLKNVEVFDSNVSAKYGNFTGGVVNAELKDPDLEKDFGSVYYRTTRDSWAQFHIQDSTSESFDAATRLDYQPKFTKHSYGVFLNQKFSDNFGVIFGYDRNTSDILYAHPSLRYKSEPNKAVTNDQKRRSETFLLKGIYFADNSDVWRTTITYAPHRSRYFKQNAINSAFTNVGGGMSALVQWDKQFDSLTMVSNLSYKRTGNNIHHDEDVYRTYRLTDSIDWTSGADAATFGGYGNARTMKESYTLKQNYSVNDFDTGALEHKVIFGWQTDFSRASFERKKSAYNYTYKVNSSIVCNGANECIDGEQLATSALLFSKLNTSVNDSSYAAYLEDRMKWKRLEVNLGARLDYNQYMKNLNVAPRFSLAYDVFGDAKTHLFGGLNRYYANSMLAYKLRENIGSVVRFNRSAGDTWSVRSEGQITGYKYTSNDVKTPYSDELTFGLGQKIGKVNLTLKWVHRNAKDQFSRELVGTEYRLANKGWSRHNTFTFALEQEKPFEYQYANVNFKAGVSYSKGKTNNNTYDASTDEEEHSKAIYQGKLIDAFALPSNDFNSKMRAFVEMNTEFPKWRLNWAQRLSYQPKQTYISNKSTPVACPSSLKAYKDICGDYEGSAAVYEDVTQGNQFLMDWRFKYTQPLWRTKTLDLTLDVNNVFDKVAMLKSNGSNIYYKMGRNFWLGAAYNF